MKKDRLKKGDEIPFTQISNRLINDPNLRLQDIGLFTWMYSKPEGYVFTIRSMAAQTNNGRDGISTCLRNLQEAGWVEYERSSEGGGWWILHLEPALPEQKPNPEKPDMATEKREPHPEKPDPENPDVLITKNNNNIGDLKAPYAREYDPEGSFELWWDIYDKKRYKKKSKELWIKKVTTEKLAREILDHTGKYVQADRRPNAKRFRKDPCTYLNQEAWQDEIISYDDSKPAAAKKQNSAKAYLDQFKTNAQ